MLQGRKVISAHNAGSSVIPLFAWWHFCSPCPVCLASLPLSSADTSARYGFAVCQTREVTAQDREELWQERAGNGGETFGAGSPSRCRFCNHSFSSLAVWAVELKFTVTSCMDSALNNSESFPTTKTNIQRFGILPNILPWYNAES